mgnify:CR=1 FL=1
MSARLARRVLRTAGQRLLPAAGGGVAILAYHLVGAGTGSPVDVPAAIFRRHMEELLEAAQPVSLDRLDEALDAPTGRPAVVVTFDDAYRNFHRVAWPILRELSIPTVLYVPVGFVEGETAAPIRGTGSLPACTWEELAEIRDEGTVALGSHGLSHTDLRRLAPRKVRRELEASQQRLAERFGVEPASFAYPEGFAPRAARREAARLYRHAVVGGGRRVYRSTPREALPRFPIRGDLSSLLPLLESRVWLEEWLGARAREARTRLRDLLRGYG